MARRHLLIGVTFVVAIGILSVAEGMLQQPVTAQEGGGTVRAPRFEVDPLWPKPLPNHWLLGSTIGVWVDERDHIWIIHRSSATLDENEKGVELKTAECCAGDEASPRLASGCGCCGEGGGSLHLLVSGHDWSPVDGEPVNDAQPGQRLGKRSESLPASRVPSPEAPPPRA